jgi:hypothetical protein
MRRPRTKDAGTAANGRALCGRRRATVSELTLSNSIKPVTHFVGSVTDQHQVLFALRNDAVLFLASDQARYLTGAKIVVDRAIGRP